MLIRIYQRGQFHQSEGGWLPPWGEGWMHPSSSGAGSSRIHVPEET